MQIKRYFNTSGPNIPSEHYTLMREELVAKGVEQVHKSRYFTIWAPRQSGKSTYFRLLAIELEKEGYKVCHVNVEAFKVVDERFLCHYLAKEMTNAYGISIKGDTIDWLFSDVLNISNEKLVFIIDEIEGLNPDLFNRFLHTIRASYHSRLNHSLKSVIFVGVSNITSVVEDNASPFNISDSFELPYFTREEVFALFGQHEKEAGQLFSEEVKNKIFDISVGQPGLVNGFGLELSKRFSEKQIIDYQDYLEVEHWYLYEALDKNVANIINKAKVHQKFMETLLFTERKTRFDIDNEKHRFLHVNGLIKADKEYNVTFWVPLYKKRLQKYFYPRLNGESEEIQTNINISEYFSADGMLNWDKIIREYQEYAKRRGFRYFIQRDEKGEPTGLLEAGLMYSFETFIQTFLQVMKGKSYLEAHVALGRSDLIVNIRGNEAVIEGKIYSNITQFVDGKAQLAYYIQSLGLKKGIYLVFASNKVTHPDVVEDVEMFDNVELTTYLVRYNLDKDFSEPRKRNYKKKDKKN